MPGAGPSRAGASIPSKTAICCSWTMVQPGDRPNCNWREDCRTISCPFARGYVAALAQSLPLPERLPDVQQFSSQISHYRPISVIIRSDDYCIAPKARARRRERGRIRPVLGLFNVSAMATPDDLEYSRACQMSYLGLHCAGTNLFPVEPRIDPGRPTKRLNRFGLKPLIAECHTRINGWSLCHTSIVKKATASAPCRPNQPPWSL